MYYDDELYHHGVKGMKWGFRRYQNKDGSLTPAGKKHQANVETRAQKKLELEQRRFTERVNSGWANSYNKAVDQMNPKLRTINEKYKDDVFDDNFTTKRGQQYIKEIDKAWRDVYGNQLISDFGKEPVSKGTSWVNKAPFMNEYADLIMLEMND